MSTSDILSRSSTPLDRLSLSSFQLWTVIMASSVVVLDGLDNQMLGIAAPSLIKEWHISKESLGDIFALGFIGMAFGTLASGWLGDRIGRRSALVAGAIIFGLATLLTGFATNLTEIAILRTVAGIGLGGTPGTAAAFIFEMTPARYRSVAVTAGMVCVALGGALGGLMATVILPHLAWSWLFYVSGTISLVAAGLIAMLLPESPRFLMTRSGRTAELEKVLKRIGHANTDMVDIADFDNARDMKIVSVPSKALLQNDLRRDSLALCGAFLTGLYMIYLMYNWTPTLLFGSGFALATTSMGLTSFNFGGVIGAILAAVAVTFLGSRVVLPLLAIIGALLCVGLALLPIANGQNETVLLLGLLALGLSASAVQSAMFSVATNAFPVELRARGMGMAGAAGRLGAIISAYSGAILTGGGNFSFFITLAALMAVNAGCLALVRNHIQGIFMKRSIRNAV